MFPRSASERPLGTADIQRTSGTLGKGLDFAEEVVWPRGAWAKGTMLKTETIEIGMGGQTQRRHRQK